MKTGSGHHAQWAFPALMALLASLTACQSAPESQAQPLSETLVNTDTTQETPCTVTAEGNLPHLMQVATQQGSVSLMLELDITHSPEGSLDPAQKDAQRQNISDAQQTIVASLAAEDRVVARFASIPFIALRVTPQTLETLFCHPLASSIREQRGYEKK